MCYNNYFPISQFRTSHSTRYYTIEASINSNIHLNSILTNAMSVQEINNAFKSDGDNGNGLTAHANLSR